MTTTQPPGLGDRLLRRREVEALTGFSRSTIYARMQNDPTWPKPVRIGPNSVAWVESEVRAWVARQIEARGMAA